MRLRKRRNKRRLYAKQRILPQLYNKERPLEDAPYCILGVRRTVCSAGLKTGCGCGFLVFGARRLLPRFFDGGDHLVADLTGKPGVGGRLHQFVDLRCAQVGGNRRICQQFIPELRPFGEGLHRDTVDDFVAVCLPIFSPSANMTRSLIISPLAAKRFSRILSGKTCNPWKTFNALAAHAEAIIMHSHTDFHSIRHSAPSRSWAQNMDS